MSALSASTPRRPSLATVGAEKAQRLDRLGIVTIRDLLYHLPRRYDDSREVTPVAHLRPGEVQTSRRGDPRMFSMRRSQYNWRMVLVEASLVDDGDTVGAVWFNQPFLTGQLRSGMELLVSGKVQRSREWAGISQPGVRSDVGAGQSIIGRLVPVYPETDGAHLEVPPQHHRAHPPPRGYSCRPPTCRGARGLRSSLPSERRCNMHVPR